MTEERIPKREELDPKYTWDLSDIYPTDEDWERDFAKFSKLPETIAGYKGRLAESADTLLEFLRLSDEIAVLCDSLGNYAQRKSDENTANAKYQAMVSRLMNGYVAINSAGSFETPELIAIPDDLLENFYKDKPELELYRRALDTVRRRKAHVLSEAEEKLLALAGDMGMSPENIFSMFSDADLKFPDAADKDGNPHAIPGHNLTAGALGVFILWFCWFGFNGGSSLSLATDEAMTMTGLVCFNTNLAAAVATCVTMIFTWLRYGKPDVSMTLNGSLAGLVAITAGCDTVSPFGAFFIGFVAGFLVVLSVEFFDNIAKVDDPVGAVSVHFANGVWGTIAVGLFSTGANTEHAGLFYGGGLAQLGTQLLGLVTVDIYVVVVMFIIFKLIDKFIGLRVPAEVEIDGLDIHEHGLASAYAGFSISDANSAAMVPNENTDLGEDDVTKATDKQISAAVPVVREPSPVIHDGVYDTGMHKVSIIAKLSKFDQLKTALNDLGVTGMTVTQVMGCGIQKGTSEKYRGVPVDTTLLPKIKVEVIVSKISVDAVVEAAKKALYTGHIGDGKIFVYNVTRVVKIRTGEEDFAALQDVE